MFDRGRGSLVVLVPGLQGRCEWLQPLANALADRHRVLAFSLSDTGSAPLFPAASARLGALVGGGGTGRAHLVGLSFGGLITARFAAEHPEQVASLTLISAPPPGWRLDRQSAWYARSPRATFPIFLIHAVLRSAPEILAARRGVRDRLAFAAEHLARAVRFPQSPGRMAAWIDEWMAQVPVVDCARVRAPTLLLTGESRLDRVVPVERSLEYLTLVPHARHVTIRGTGHLGFLLKPREVADLISEFAAGAAADSI